MSRSGQRVVFVGGDSTPPRDLAVAFDVVAVRDRTAAVDSLEATAVSCVVVDGTEANRVDTVAAIREAAPSVPIVYTTERPDGTAAAAATRAGATEYLVRTTDATLVDRVVALSPEPLAIGPTDPTSPDREHPAGGYITPSDAIVGPRHAAVVTELLETTRALFSCESRVAVADIVVDAAERVLGFDVVTVRLFDADTAALVLTGASDPIRELFDERKRVGIHESAMGEAFRNSEPVVIDDGPPPSSGAQWATELFRSTMCVPIGTLGVLNVGSPISCAFDDYHVELAQLLTASAAAALERSNRREELMRYEQVLETLEGMVYAVDTDGRLTLVTDPLAERLGYDGEQLIGEPVSLLFDDESYERAVERVDELLAEPQRDNAPFEATYVTADGERFPVEIEWSLLARDEAEIEPETFRGIVSVVRDITQRKEREQYLQVLNRVLRHNLRNDLTVVIGYAELLCERLDHPELATAADTLRETATDLARTSEKTRAIQYALDRDSDLQPIDVADVLEVAIDEADIDDGTLTVTTRGDCRAWADPGLRLVVDNLLENAVRHTGPEPTIDAAAVREGDRVRLSVSDDGPGIPPAEIGVITGESDITQLTHSSGLGLWLVRWMVDSYGGTVSFAQSTLGGSRVEIALEAASTDATDSA
ncbi:sensor histidine kinase [Natrinema ejinorense]|uniref:histidine kinase n=1 Tax=Natrinema ejinorense TaxID=373386 RepID=A0A2A5QXD5_9EURY|nr:ATP-binding protein [Natrinema ejinorense]PCR91490.1 histidine kinase [Natrinema ejinorense]